MNCSFTEKVSAWIDGELPASELPALELHLLECHDCQQARADFKSLGSEIGSYAFRPVQVPPPRLARLVSPPAFSGRQSWPGRFAGGLSPRRLHPAWAAVAAILLIAGGVALVLKLRSTRRDPDTSLAQERPASAPVASPTVNSKPAVDNDYPRGATQEPDREIKVRQPASKDRKPETVAILTVSNQNSRRSAKPNAGELPAQSGKPGKTDDEPLDMNLADVLTGSADSETLTARHVEQSELLLRSFRNLRPSSTGVAGDLGYERRRAQQLFYQNVMLRRQADRAGDVQVATLLESLEPVLLDIANLPQRDPGSEVRAIKDRLERQNLVALLQINSRSQVRFNQ
jgi:hypothetical protein